MGLSAVAFLAIVIFQMCLSMPAPDEERYFDKEVKILLPSVVVEVFNL